MGVKALPWKKTYIQKTPEMPGSANRDEWRRLMREAKARKGL